MGIYSTMSRKSSRNRNINYPSDDILDFSGGMNNKLDDNLIQKNQCTDVQNCICVTVGKLQGREGQSYLSATPLAGAIQGLSSYYYGNELQNRKIITASNGTIYVWAGNSWQSIKTGLNTTADIMFETTINYMVFFDGSSQPCKYDGTTVTNLLNAPISGRCPTLHKEKLFVITGNDEIKWSDDFEPEIWPVVNIEKFDQGDGDSLVGLWSIGRELLICKKRRIWSLIGSSWDDFRTELVSPNSGVVGARAGYFLNPSFFYISYDGIMQYNGLISVNLTENTIPATWSLVNKAALSKAVVNYNPKYNQLWFHLPEGVSTTNNMVIVYDLTFKSWWVHRGIEASCMMPFNDGQNLKIYTGNYSGYIVEQNTGFNDLGVAITSYWIGKNFDNGDPVKEKKIKKFYPVDAFNMNDAVFQYRLNNGSWQTPTATTDKNDVRKFKIPNGKCRFFQTKFSHSVLNQDFALSGFKTEFDPGRNK